MFTNIIFIATTTNIKINYISFILEVNFTQTSHLIKKKKRNVGVFIVG